MAVAALIGRAVSGENPLKVWGDGSAVRDFTYADDVALGMLQALAQAPSMLPVNLSCGVGYSVKDAVTAILKSLGRPVTDAVFDASQPQGSPSRLLSIERAKTLFGFAPATSLEDGIRKAVEWYVANQDVADKRYNPFLGH
jgi:GDP-L-fucose synthase